MRHRERRHTRLPAWCIAALVALAAGCGQSPPQIPTGIAHPDESPVAATPAATEKAKTAGPTGIRGRGTAHIGRAKVSPEARRIADWVVDSADNRGLPFLIVDKVNARVIAFDADGYLRGASPALLGLARGDDSVPGIGERPMADIRPDERTTPAGRFIAEMGENSNGEDILWVDYDAAVSMHRVRTSNAAERRLQRLASATPKDNRISYGCINLPVSFYEHTVKALFEPRNGIVYVLPETRPAKVLFGAYDVGRAVGG
jgi:hypothetical protein